MTKKIRKLSKQTRSARKDRFAGLRKHWLAVGLIVSLGVGGIAVGSRYLEEDATGQGATSAQRTPPKLTKEYIYAGSRMLAVEDAGESSSGKSESAPAEKD